MAKKDYSGVLLEDMDDKIDFLIDVMKGMQESTKKIPKIDERLEKIEYDIPAIKFTTKMTNDDMKLVKIRTEKLQEGLEEFKTDAKQLIDHEKRLVKLEASAQA